MRGDRLCAELSPVELDQIACETLDGNTKELKPSKDRKEGPCQQSLIKRWGEEYGVIIRFVCSAVGRRIRGIIRFIEIKYN